MSSAAAASQPAPAPAAQNPGADGRWAKVFARILQVEGSAYTNAPDDQGGPTKFGISLRFLAAECHLHPELLQRFDIDRNLVIDDVDVRDLTADSVELLYRPEFWVRTGFWTLPEPFDAALTDEAVNAGPVSAVKLLQVALNSLMGSPPIDVDGGLGPATRSRLSGAIAAKGTVPVLDAYRAQACGRYRQIVAADPTQERFLQGWLNRALSLGNV